MGSPVWVPERESLAIPSRVTLYMLYVSKVEVRIQMVGNPLISRDLYCHLDQVIYAQNCVLGLQPLSREPPSDQLNNAKRPTY